MSESCPKEFGVSSKADPVEHHITSTVFDRGRWCFTRNFRRGTGEVATASARALAAVGGKAPPP